MEQRYNRCPYKHFYRVRDQENTARGPVYVTIYICDIIQAPSFVCRRRHSGSFDIHPGGHRCGQVLREFPVHTTPMLVRCCPGYKPAGAVHIISGQILPQLENCEITAAQSFRDLSDGPSSEDSAIVFQRPSSLPCTWTVYSPTLSPEK